MGTPISESVRSEANLQPLGTAAFQSASLPNLVNPPTTFVLLENSSINNTSSRDLSPRQEQAIATLRHYHNSDIIAWHTLSRSTEPGLKHQDGPGGLSTLDIHAISILRDCSRENLLRWLESPNQKSSPSPGLSASKFAAAALSRQTRRPSPVSPHAFGHPSLVGSAGVVPSHLSNNSHSFLTAAQNHHSPGPTFPRDPAYSKTALLKPKNPSFRYWCTVCDNHSFQHSDGWKKHEKEHEIRYVCMLKGLFEATKGGRRCILCGALDQPDNHHLAHNIAPCVEAANRPSFKRRYDMVDHLKDAHNIKYGGCIADEWRCISSKKAWSCGFCIHLFPSLQHRLKHIGTEHFEKGQSIKDWNYSKVILGLLLQPEINEVWQLLSESLDPFRPSMWDKFRSGDLQHRLEKGLAGDETPQSLAKAAYDCAEYDWSSADKDPTASTTTMDTVPNQYMNKNSPPPLHYHSVASEETRVDSPAWSPPQQTFQIPRSTPPSEAQGTYGTAALSSSPAHFVPALDYRPVWEPLSSDTDDMNHTQPTTPYNDKFNPANPSVYSPWSGNNITPDPSQSDQERFFPKSNNKVDWSAQPHSNVDVKNASSSLKHPRDSPSPPTQGPLRKESLKERPRKKAYGKKSDENKARSQALDLDYVPGRMNDEGT